MIIRNDIHRSTVYPKDLQDTCLRVGGTNPYNEPLYRLLLAQDRVTKASGEWNIWPEDASLDDRGGLGIENMQKMIRQAQQVISAMQERGFAREDIEKISMRFNRQIDEYFNSKLDVHPLRVDTGMAEVPLYVMEGWIIEKWIPAEMCGSREEWESFKFRGEAALGPYPQFGDYKLCAGPSPYQPTSSQIEEAIRQDFRNVNERPASPQERVRLLLEKVQERKAIAQRERKNQAEAFAKDGPASLRNRLSLGAGRVIQELADEAGLKGHYGN